MGLRIAAVILIVTVLTYWHLYSTLKSDILDDLRRFAHERSRSESELFLLAETQTDLMAQQIGRHLADYGQQDPQAEFDHYFQRDPDGLVRVRPEFSDTHRYASAYLRHDVALTPDLRRRVLSSWHTLTEQGPLAQNRFFQAFVNMPEQLSINYLPGVDWSKSATRDTDIYIYETVWRATREKNPLRKPFWTSVYYDEGAKQWMVSHVTPVDVGGYWAYTAGHDILIGALIERTHNEHLAGTYNLIVNRNGELIAHPRLMDTIRKAGGNLQVTQLGDAPLQSMVRTALAGSPRKGEQVLESEETGNLLAVSPIQGPDWLFITVYPKSLLTARAWPVVRTVFGLGLLALVAELLILRWILRREVARPLEKLMAVTHGIEQGDYTVPPPNGESREAAQLMRSLGQMANSLSERDAALKESTDTIIHQMEMAEESQARMRAILAAMPDPAYFLSADGTFLDVLGKTHVFRVEELLGKRLIEVLPPDTAALCLAHIRDCVISGEMQIFEFEVEAAEGTRWLEARTVPVYPAHPGHTPAVLAVTRDVTGRKQADAELTRHRDHLAQLVAEQTHDLMRARDIAEAANRVKSEFLSNMSHELRTPMHAILSFAKLGLEKGPNDPSKVPRYFQNVFDASNRLLALINDLLDLAKLEAGKVVYDMYEQPVGPILQECKEELANLITAKQLTLRLPDEDMLTEPLWCDRVRVGQVMRNLLSNAIKFAPERSTLTLSLQDSPLQPEFVRISLTNEGPTIPTDELESIFDKFVQSRRHRGKNGGTGLGLPICREIVHAHGGRIWAENIGQPDGVRFIFLLRRRAPGLVEAFAPQV